MRNLKDLLYGVSISQTVGRIDVQVEEIQFDSRNIKENDVFVAVRGVTVDGHNYIEKAISLGAKVVICEDVPDAIAAEVTYVQVENAQIALGVLASNYYNNPTKDLKLVGVTGTNGKTTTTTLLYELFTKLGYACALISTIKIVIDGEVIPSTHTTPDILTLNKMFREAVDRGCEFAFMEVSSHGIHQNRIAGLHFAVAGFNNITHDHLDYHKTFANTDALTGVSNRLALEQYVKLLDSHTEKLQHTGLIILDIDDFKKVNDSYGHIIGDQVIQFVANKLKSNLRTSDVIVRYGGDEFIIILDSIDAKDTVIVADKIRLDISEII